HWHKVRELGRSLADEEAKDSRLRACSVILASGSWRLGMSEDDARGCLDEGCSLAQELGRPSAMAVAVAGFAGHPGQLGRLEAALQVADEAKRMLSDGMDLGEIITVEWTHAY